MKTIKYFFLLSFFFLLGGCNTTVVKEAMVEFDKAFIPAYYYTYIDDLEHAEKALIVLDRKYQNLYSNFEQKATDGHNWRASFQMVAAWLDEAKAAIRANDASLAMLQLDHARYELMDFRWREGIPYYLDKVYDLEAAIDLVVEVSTDPKLDLYEWGEFELMVEDLEVAWNEVQNATWEKELFPFSRLTIEKEMERKFNLGLAIKTFAVATAYADASVIADAARTMEIAYLDYLYNFGDFEATKTYYALSE